MDTNPKDSLLPDALIHPLTGEIIDQKDINALARAYLEAKASLDEMRRSVSEIRLVAGALTNNEKRTRYLSSAEYEVKLEYGGYQYPQPLLRRILTLSPEFAARVIRPATFAVIASEMQKMQNATVSPEWREPLEHLLTHRHLPTTPSTMTVKRVK